MTTTTAPNHGPRRSSLHDDDGIALITVIGLSFVAMLLVVAALGAATSNLPSSRFHQDNEAAEAAAEAGIDDLVFRLDFDPLYYLRTTDADNEALNGWKTVPGGRAGGASYHYEIDASETAQTGFITIRSTGRVNGVERTIESRIRKSGFLDQIYLTDYEVLDAQTFHQGGTDDAATYRHYCQRHRDDTWTDNRTVTYQYEGTGYAFGPFGELTGRIDFADAYLHLYYKYRGATDATRLDDSEIREILGEHRPYCGEIRFVTGDVIDGPLHSNDGIMIDGDPRFLGEVTTSYRLGDETVDEEEDLWIDQDGSSDPYFQEGIRRRSPLELPPTNSSIRGFAAADGCVFRGPTYIRVLPPASVGADSRLFVHSPLSVGHTTPRCPLRTPFPRPDNGVVYVEDAPVSCSRHPLGLEGSGYGTTTTDPYGCNDGDVFMWGRVAGQFTIGAENDVVVVGDTTYANGLVSGTDVLGLVANRFVKVFHPVRYNGSAWVNRNVPNGPPFVVPAITDTSFSTTAFTESTRPGSNTWQDPQIHAAMVALEHSFLVENWNRGQPFNSGDLSVRGVIAQKSRGPVGTSNSSGKASGYDKDYVYDDRLENLSPPFFIEPVQAAWAAREFAEVDESPDCTADQDPAVDDCLPASP